MSGWASAACPALSRIVSFGFEDNRVVMALNIVAVQLEIVRKHGIAFFLQCLLDG